MLGALHLEKDVAESIAALATLGLVIVTAVLAGFTLALWRSTSNLVRGERESSKRAPRAYVTPGHVSAPAIAGVGRRISIELRNGGKTPTRHLRMRLNFGTSPDGWPANFNYSDVPHGVTTAGHIGPDQSIYTPHVDVPVLTIQQVVQGQTRVYVWGWVD